MHDIIRSHPEVRFGVVHMTWDSTSPQAPYYDVPENVHWIAPSYFSMREHPEFMDMNARALKLSSRQRRELAQRIVTALDGIRHDECGPFWELYDDHINPKTTSAPLWPIMATREAMRVVQELCPADTPLANMFWLVRELISQTYAVASFEYPVAKVYHAHTSAWAAFAGAVAARQNSGAFVLTEHNLYVRDTINERLGRSMALPVTRSDWSTADVTGATGVDGMAHRDDDGRLSRCR